MALEIPELDYSIEAVKAKTEADILQAGRRPSDLADMTAEQMAAREMERLGLGNEIHRKRNRLERRRIAATLRSTKWQKLNKAAEKAVLRRMNDEHAVKHNANVQLEPENEAWD